MKKMTMRTEGFRELDAALKELPRATARNVARRTLLKAATPIAEAASALAPVNTGRLSADIEPGTRLSRRQRALHRRQSPVEVFVGPSADPRGLMQELGTAHHPPQPFLRPAFDANVHTALGIIRTELKTEIDKAVARAARRAAKRAGK